MKAWPLAASAALHAAIVGAALWCSPPSKRIADNPICFFEIEEMEQGTGDGEGCATSRPILPVTHSQPSDLSTSQPQYSENIVDSVDSVRDIQVAPLPVPSPPVSNSQPPVPSPPVPRSHVISRQAALVGRIEPHYPRSARRRGHEGIVTLAVTVSREGRAKDVALVSSSGFRELDNAAMDAARTAQFVVAEEDGVPVEDNIELTIEFKLK